MIDTNMWWKAIVFVVVAVAVLELIGFLASRSQTMQRTPASPPGWVFALMWSLIFAILGVVFSFLVFYGMQTSWMTSGDFGYLAVALLTWAALTACLFAWSPLFGNDPTNNASKYWIASCLFGAVLLATLLNMLTTDPESESSLKTMQRVSTLLILLPIVWLLFALLLSFDKIQN